MQMGQKAELLMEASAAFGKAMEGRPVAVVKVVTLLSLADIIKREVQAGKDADHQLAGVLAFISGQLNDPTPLEAIIAGQADEVGDV